MKLFRMTMKSVDPWNKKKIPLYVMDETKEGAIEYVNRVKKDRYVIDKVAYLGHEVSGRLYSGSKEDK